MKSANLEKYECLINQITDDSTADRALIHDVQAQLINIKGFVKEVTNSVEQMKLTIASNDLPTEFVRNISSITDNDMEPCIKYIELSTDQLSKILVSLLDPPQHDVSTTAGSTTARVVKSR